ncbi:MAG: putative Fe-S oxidoreductase [Candidatus Ozemobacter sibiricus]|jgi:hypothetical protein|uniref:Putative Fe-S oxidoreductase n=1 Tax=Candidatus Ozemobacter sibiricus TaxID=2268124 RepID=A0A367ZQY0_9BACT|nr:MAG: putative Fe-S oxidoreductase [Candidatus Ozemobacter sibiricus]
MNASRKGRSPQRLLAGWVGLVFLLAQTIPGFGWEHPGGERPAAPPAQVSASVRQSSPIAASGASPTARAAASRSGAPVSANVAAAREAGDDDPVGDAPEAVPFIPVGSQPTPVEPGPASPPRQMSLAEQSAWSAARAAAAAAGSTLGAAAGAVALPAVVTAIVGALGISTAGTGFVGGVILPAMPLVGKILGSAIGSALFSSVVAVAYEVRMNQFRAVPKTAAQIARDVAKSAAFEAAVGAATFGLGGGAGAATSQTLKQTLTKILEKAATRFLAESAINVLVRKLPGMQHLPGAPFEPGPTGELPTVPEEPEVATGPPPPPQVGGPQGTNPLASSRPTAMMAAPHARGQAIGARQEASAARAGSEPISGRNRPSSAGRSADAQGAARPERVAGARPHASLPAVGRPPVVPATSDAPADSAEADAAMQNTRLDHADHGPGDRAPAHGFSADVERRARVGLVTEPLAAVASLVPGTLGGGLGLRLSVAISLDRTME